MFSHKYKYCYTCFSTSRNNCHHCILSTKKQPLLSLKQPTICVLILLVLGLLDTCLFKRFGEANHFWYQELKSEYLRHVSWKWICDQRLQLLLQGLLQSLPIMFYFEYRLTKYIPGQLDSNNILFTLILTYLFKAGAPWEDH